MSSALDRLAGTSYRHRPGLPGQLLERAAALAFPKIATIKAGTSAPGIVISKIQPSGAAAMKTTPDRRTPPQAPRWPTPSVQPVPRPRIRVG